MKTREGWRGFDILSSGYKLDNQGKPVVDQSLVQNLKLRIIQVSALGNSLFPMPPPPSVPLQILPFVTTDAITYGQYFCRQGTKQQNSDNSIYSVSINGRPSNGPVYYDKVNCIT